MIGSVTDGIISIEDMDGTLFNVVRKGFFVSSAVRLAAHSTARDVQSSRNWIIHGKLHFFPLSNLIGISRVEHVPDSPFVPVLCWFSSP